MANKNQKMTLDALAELVKTEIGGVKKDIGAVKKEVGTINRKLSDFIEEYTNADLETRVTHIETVLNIPTPTEE